MAPKIVARILGVGLTALNPKPPCSSLQLMLEALELALKDAKLRHCEVDALIGLPSLLGAKHFMPGHVVATAAGLVPAQNVLIRSLDTGGAGPVTALLEARRMILHEGRQVVAVVAADAVHSAPLRTFLDAADQACQRPDGSLASPVIPTGYDLVAQWHMKQYGLRRDHLAMCTALMSLHASRHPHSLKCKPLTVEDVLASPSIAPVTTQLECARRADGGAAYLVVSSQLLEEKGLPADTGVAIVGGGEGSGPLYPPEAISESMFSAHLAADSAYREAGLGPSDMDFFGLYDCFPICLVRAIEAVRLADKGGAGAWLQERYRRLVVEGEAAASSSRLQELLPVNTHGGLMCFGAPWEVPAMYNIIEAHMHLTGRAGSRQIPHARRALVYGNGGIFSSSAVAILSSGSQ